MNQKNEITAYIANQYNLATDKKSVRNWIARWWYSTRKKSKGGLRLTDEGFLRMSTHFKPHKVELDADFDYTNQLIIRLDNFIDCPWYINSKNIYVFDDKMAVQLILFAGNIARFSNAKALSIKNHLTNP
jgi:hypothetical protein